MPRRKPAARVIDAEPVLRAKVQLSNAVWKLNRVAETFNQAGLCGPAQKMLDAIELAAAARDLLEHVLNPRRFPFLGQESNP